MHDHYSSREGPAEPGDASMVPDPSKSRATPSEDAALHSGVPKEGEAPAIGEPGVLAGLEPATRAQPNRTLSLPNGMVSKPYLVRGHEIAGLPALFQPGCRTRLPEGLSANEEGTISGTPTSAGTFRVSWLDSNDGEFARAELVILPDPRTLWRNLDPDASAPHAKSNEVVVLRSSPVARLAAASVRGRSHAHTGAFREDDFRVTAPVDAHGWHIVCLADGAGSAALARRGSELLVTNFTRTIKALLESTDTSEQARQFDLETSRATEEDKSNPKWTACLHWLFVSAARSVHEEVESECREAGLARKDLASTVLIVIARRSRAGHWFVSTFGVGDCVAGMWHEAWAKPKVFSSPDAGEFAGQTTFFHDIGILPEASLRARISYTVVPAFGMLAAMSDGVWDPKFGTETALRSAEAWRALSRDLQEVVAGMDQDFERCGDTLKNWLGFWSPGSHDDRTLVLLRPVDPETEPES